MSYLFKSPTFVSRDSWLSTHCIAQAKASKGLTSHRRCKAIAEVHPANKMRHSYIPVRLYWLKLLIGAMLFTVTLAQNTASTNPSGPSTAAGSFSPSPTTFQSSTSTSSSAPQTHTVQVGLLDHKMRPESTEAEVGDTIEFDFYPLNHSVVRAEYGFPCIPYEMTGSGKKGFFSGFNPVDKVLDNPPKFSVRVNDTEPILFYCSAPGSCITWGMVGGINLNSSMSIDRQRTLAMDSAYMLQPGKPH